MFDRQSEIRLMIQIKTEEQQIQQFYLIYNIKTEIQTTKMKQLLSMPSTKPEQFLYTDFSVVSPSNHPKYSLGRIISYMKNVLKMRLYLCQRDLQQMYNNDAQFFNTTLNVYSSEQLWNKINKNNDQTLRQRQMISLLTKILLKLTKQKNICAQNKKFDKFAGLKNTIQWLEDKIVEMQNEIRDKIKQFTVKKRVLSQMKREEQFQNSAGNIKQSLISSTKQFAQQLKKHHKKEKLSMQNTIKNNVQNQAYLYKPSKKLSQAKDTSLLAKLAPFKSEKKRPFQCKSLQKQLQTQVQEGKQLTRKEIQSYKKNERQKIRRRQEIQKQSYLSRLQNRNNQALAKLQVRRDQLDKSERIKMNKLIQQNNKLTRQRISSLRNSLRAYSMRDQTKQISNILKKHRETIQFVNNIEDIAQTQNHKDYLSSKYVTLDVQSQQTKARKSMRYDDDRLQTKIIRRIKNNQTQMSMKYNDEQTEFSSGRKSLVNLYDHELKQV